MTPTPPIARPCLKCGSRECGPIRCRFEDPAAAIHCDTHPDREGILTIDLPSTGTRRAMCPECRVAFDAALAASPRSYARAGKDPWGNILEWSTGGMAYETGNAWSNPNAQYARNQRDGSGSGGPTD